MHSLPEARFRLEAYQANLTLILLSWQLEEKSTPVRQSEQMLGPDYLVTQLCELLDGV